MKPVDRPRFECVDNIHLDIRRFMGDLWRLVGVGRRSQVVGFGFSFKLHPASCSKEPNIFPLLLPPAGLSALCPAYS